MSCSLQMQCFHDGLPSRHGVYNHRLQSDDESCPNRAKTHRWDCQIHFCNHSNRGRNLQSHLASSETPSNLHRQFFDHRTLQIHPNHQDWFYTLHWSCYRFYILRHSPCKLKLMVLKDFTEDGFVFYHISIIIIDFCRQQTSRMLFKRWLVDIVDIKRQWRSQNRTLWDTTSHRLFVRDSRSNLSWLNTVEKIKTRKSFTMPLIP